MRLAGEVVHDIEEGEWEVLERSDQPVSASYGHGVWATAVDGAPGLAKKSLDEHVYDVLHDTDGLAVLVEKGLSHEMLPDPYVKAAFNFASHFLREKGEAPSLVVLETEYPGLEFGKPEVDPGWLADQLRKRALRNVMQDTLCAAAEKSGDPDEAYRYLKERCELFEGMSDPADTAYRVMRLSELPMEHTQWIWENWIPKKSLTLLAGEGGIGKSTFLCGLAAQLTRGELNDGQTGNALILSLEDSYEGTIVPRLVAGGADLERCYSFSLANEAYDEPPVLPRDIPKLADAIEKHQIDLMILDPGNGYLDVENAHADVDMRRALGPLAGLAKKHNCGVVFLVHLNKNVGGSFMHRVIGSVASVNAARAVLGMGISPGDDQEIVLAHAKANLAPKQKSLRYKVVEDAVANDADEVFDTIKLEKIGESDLTADDLVAKKMKGSPKLDAGIAFLSTALEEGPRETNPLKDEFRVVTGATSNDVWAQALSEVGAVTQKRSGVYHTGFVESF